MVERVFNVMLALPFSDDVCAVMLLQQMTLNMTFNYQSNPLDAVNVFNDFMIPRLSSIAISFFFL